MKKPTKKVTPLIKPDIANRITAAKPQTDDHTVAEKMEPPNMTAAENGSSYVTSDEHYQKTFETYDAVYGTSYGETKWAGQADQAPDSMTAAEAGNTNGQAGQTGVAGPNSVTLGDEEFAAEMAPSAAMGHPNGAGLRAMTTDNKKAGGQARVNLTGQTIGWIALVLAISSLFIWPAFLGSVAIVAGIYAWVKGRKALGGWSVGIGLLSVLSSLLLGALF